MTTDSLFFESPSKEFADSLFQAMQVVGNNTDEFSGPSLLITVISAIASILTIFGIGTILYEWFKRKINKDCQRRIIMDMIRHMFTNNSMSEAIRLKMSKEPEGSTLREGILERFCFLDSDIELSDMNFTAKSYETLHSIKLRLKNYNSVARMAEKHFTDPDCPKKIRIEDLDDIWERSVRLTKAFLEYARLIRLGLDEQDIQQYILQYHQEQDRIPAWENAHILDSGLTVPDRARSRRAFYDDAPYGLTQTLDTCIRYRSNIVKFRRKES